MRQSITIRGFSFILVLLACFTLGTTRGSWSQSTPPSSAQPKTAEATGAPVSSASPVLVIGGGDLLRVSVLGAAESDQEVRVDQEGNASLNFLGSVHLEGLTASQAQSLIAKKLE